MVILIIAIAPALGGGSGSTECYAWVEERYYEDTGEIVGPDDDL